MEMINQKRFQSYLDQNYEKLSDDEDNSWAQDVSLSQDEEEEGLDDEYYGEEEEEDDPPPPQKTITNKATIDSEAKTIDQKVIGAKKVTINVYCTEYDVVRKVSKKVVDFKVKEIAEDHDGGVHKGVGGQKLSLVWDISWHDLAITPDFLSKLQPYQKVNHFPGMYVVCRKNFLARNLMKMLRCFPEEYNFFPQTWLLPSETVEFKSQFQNGNLKQVKSNKTYIIKPEGLSQGKGIFLSRNLDEIMDASKEEGCVVQRYIHKPYLIDDLKFDLRVYVLLYGVNPLRIYIHEMGLARFATEEYQSPLNSNLDNLYIHLTNYAINKNNNKFKQNEDEEEDEQGHKRSLHAIRRLLAREGHDSDKLWNQIKDIIVKTLMIGQPYLAHLYKSCQPEDLDGSRCFQVLGFDILIDHKLRPYLLEVNQSPSFATDSPLDYKVKKAVLGDTFSMLNCSYEDREMYIMKKREEMAKRIYTGKLNKISPEEREKIRQEKLKARFEFEEARQGGFELIYPSKDEEREKQYQLFIEKANYLWDEFTTGNKSKKAREALLEKKGTSTNPTVPSDKPPRVSKPLQNQNRNQQLTRSVKNQPRASFSHIQEGVLKNRVVEQQINEMPEILQSQMQQDFDMPDLQCQTQQERQNFELSQELAEQNVGGQAATIQDGQRGVLGSCQNSPPKHVQYALPDGSHARAPDSEPRKFVIRTKGESPFKKIGYSKSLVEGNGLVPAVFVEEGGQQLYESQRIGALEGIHNSEEQSKVVMSLRGSSNLKEFKDGNKGRQVGIACQPFKNQPQVIEDLIKGQLKNLDPKVFQDNQHIIELARQVEELQNYSQHVLGSQILTAKGLSMPLKIASFKGGVGNLGPPPFNNGYQQKLSNYKVIADNQRGIQIQQMPIYSNQNYGVVITSQQKDLALPTKAQQQLPNLNHLNQSLQNYSNRNGNGSSMNKHRKNLNQYQQQQQNNGGGGEKRSLLDNKRGMFVQSNGFSQANQRGFQCKMEKPLVQILGKQSHSQSKAGGQLSHSPSLVQEQLHYIHQKNSQSRQKHEYNKFQGKKIGGVQGLSYVQGQRLRVMRQGFDVRGPKAAGSNAGLAQIELVTGIALKQRI